MELKNCKVLVTGGTAGIGAELSQLLLQQGCQVIICGRQKEALAAAGKQAGAFPMYGDLSDPADTQRMAQEIAQQHPDLAVIINNAALQVEFTFSAMPAAQAIEIAEHETRINFLAPLAINTILLPTLAKQRQAMIVNVTTPLALSPKKSSPVYCASKAALRSYTRSLRYQLADSHPHISVVEVQPPLVDTGMTRGRGNGKISPQQAALGILQGVSSGAQEVYVGKAKLMRVIQRWAPAVAEGITKRW